MQSLAFHSRASSAAEAIEALLDQVEMGADIDIRAAIGVSAAERRTRRLKCLVLPAKAAERFTAAGEKKRFETGHPLGCRIDARQHGAWVGTTRQRDLQRPVLNDVELLGPRRRACRRPA